VETTHDLRALAEAVLREDVQTLARTTQYLRRSYRIVFIGYVAMMVFGVGAIVAAFIKGLMATSLAEAAAAVGLAGLTVGIFVAFFVQRPSAALERNAIFMPWVSIVLTTFWTRLLYMDDPETLDAKLGHAAKEADQRTRRSTMAMRLTRPRHGDPVQTTAQLRELAAAVLSEDVRTLARTTAYLRRSYRTVFVAYLAMLTFGLAAVVAAFVKGLEADSIGEAAAAIGLCGLTVGIFVAFFVQRPSAALQRNAIFMPWVSIVLTTFWTRMLYLDDPETFDAKLGKAAKEASDELSAIAMRYAVIDGKELTVAKEAARTRPTIPKT
jgi:FtsH-binding integral membrane protein